MCSCQAYGKSGVPNARGFCLVCGERVVPTVEPDTDGYPGTTSIEEDDPRYAADSHARSAADFCRDSVGHGCFALDLDNHVQAYTPSVRDRLIERGVLRAHADGFWHLAWHGFDLEKEHAEDMSCCDFCSARPVTWLVPCATFDMPAARRGPWCRPPRRTPRTPPSRPGSWRAADRLAMGVDYESTASRRVPKTVIVVNCEAVNGDEFAVSIRIAGASVRATRTTYWVANGRNAARS